MSQNGITVKILGDFGPFSRMGKSIGYEIQIDGGRYLLDCGAPLFQHIGGHGLKDINGLMVTHCHDDHKRWFTDLVLFNMYARDVSQRVPLITSEDIHDELIRASGPALDRSLSEDSKSIVDIAFNEFINFHVLGPRSRYRIISQDEGAGKTGLHIIDRNGSAVGPDQAKIVISRKTGRPRMLFRDPGSGEWVEPESFYPFSSNVFYEENKNSFRAGRGCTFDAIKAPVWHGIPAIGIRITCGDETLIFSSDTVNDVGLWRQLASEKREQRLAASREEFEAATVIYGDINDYIERVWSGERYQEAINVFQNAIVIHDVSSMNSVVHTDYERLDSTLLRKENVILTHSPDRITSEWVLGDSDKVFRISGKKFFEVVGDELYPLNADIYHKDMGKFYVGYKNDNGMYVVYEKDGLLSVSEEKAGIGKPLYRVDLFEDIYGMYFPKIDDGCSRYVKLGDGRVERLQCTDTGSTGERAEDSRRSLLKR